MTLIDTGTYGAKVQSWRRANPRELLKRLIEEDSKAGRDCIFRAFREKLRGDDAEEFLDSIIDYWFSNNYHSLIDGPARTRKPRQAVTRTQVENIKNTIQSRLIDMRLPNGKTLGDSTFGYCLKLGGGLARIGAKGKSNEIVRKHLSEPELRKLYQDQ